MVGYLYRRLLAPVGFTNEVIVPVLLAPVGFDSEVFAFYAASVIAV